MTNEFKVQIDRPEEERVIQSSQTRRIDGMGSQLMHKKKSRRPVLRILGVALCTLGVSVIAKAEQASDLGRATAAAVSTYEVNGISGLITEIRKCYAEGKKPASYCISLDLAAQHIDTIVIASAKSQGMTFPPQEYLSLDAFVERAKPIVLENRTSREASDYLADLQNEVNRAVNKEISKRR